MMQCIATVLLVLCGLLIFSHAKENQCPGEKASCSDDSTCCVLSNGSFGCCPIQNAVCCGDSVHCCPDGYTCDVIKGICKMARCKKRAEDINVIETIQAIKNSRAGECIKGFETKVKKTSALVTKISAALQLLPRVICPDGTICFPKYKCCPNGHGFYKCCPRVSF